jgi:mannose-6-phosphate isomerase class I
MQTPSTAAHSARQIAGRVIVTAANNFVERPWGGTQLRELKGLCSLPEQVEVSGFGLGESFELAAFDDDQEAAEHPSRIIAPDEDLGLLPDLIRAHAEALLGESWVARYGRCIPLLPKFLNVRELLSVQGHPAGHTEAYIVVDAEPGATIRLGFRHDIDPGTFGAELEAGLAEQRALAELLGDATDWFAVQRLLAQWFADRGSDARQPAASLREISASPSSDAAFTNASRLLESLKRRYWLVLDSMNEIELTPGMVIHNTNPQRIVDASGQAPAAEVHALGNPERREFVMLEVRRPGPTFRAWDNVRFPMREIDIATALDVLNLQATEPEEFLCSRSELSQPGHTLSVDSPYFRIEHIEAREGESFDVAASDPCCLHVLAGNVEIAIAGDSGTTSLRRGDSAFVPNGVGAWSGRVPDGDLHLVKVHLP